MQDTQNQIVELEPEMELKRLTLCAKEFVKELDNSLFDTRQSAQRSVNFAWHIGGLCIEAKKITPHGGYGIWLESIGISHPTAHRYTALRSKFSTLKDLETANAQREGYLALLVPSKEHPQLDGDAALPAREENPLGWVNNFSRWNTKHGESVSHEQIRANGRKVFEFLLPAFMEEVAAMLREEAA